MAILVYTESEQGKFKKTAFELASYARSIADENNTTVTAVCINAESPMELQNYGVDKVLNISNQELKSFNAMSYSQCIFEAAENEKSKIHHYDIGFTFKKKQHTTDIFFHRLNPPPFLRLSIQKRTKTNRVNL